MSQFTSAFWDVYIGLITLVSIIACAVLLKMQSVRGPAESETSGHVWDEDIREYNNPLPRWWMWLFYLTIFSASATWCSIRALAAMPARSAGAR